MKTLPPAAALLYPLPQLAHYARHPDAYGFSMPLGEMLKEQATFYGRWYAASAAERFGRRERALPPTTFVTLAYKRQRNMFALVSGLLALPFARRVVVINNNPSIPLERFLPKDRRVELVSGTGAIGMRYVVAEQLADERYAFIDDDAFLMPDAWRRLVLGLEAAPQAPKGLIGVLFVPTGDGSHHPSLPPLPIDFGEGTNYWIQIADAGMTDLVAAGISVCRLEHVKRLLALATEARVDMDRMSTCDDLFLAVSGTERPRTVGAVPGRDFMFCLSATRKDVAISQSRNGYFFERRDMYLELQRLAGFGDDDAIVRRRAEVIRLPTAEGAAHG